MNDEVIVSFRGIEKRRHNLHIGPLDIDIPAGCVTAIVGMNGSGKSSVMGMLLGLLHPEAGELFVEGRIYDVTRDMDWKRNIGYVAELPASEEDDCTPDQLAKQNAYWYPSWDWQLYQQLVARYEIDPRTKLSKMSKGMRRKAEIVLVLAYRPKVLLLDEPTSGLDPITWRMVIEDLQAMLCTGKHTIMIATHVIEEVKRLADYILFFHRGQVLTMTEKDALFDDWKEYWLEGVALDKVEQAPGLAAIMEERQLLRVIACEANLVEQFFRDNHIVPLRTQAMSLDEVMLYRIRMENERRETVR